MKHKCEEKKVFFFFFLGDFRICAAHELVQVSVRVLSSIVENGRCTCVSRKPFGLTSTENNGSNKQGQITVIQLQRIKLHSKLKLGLHDLTEGLP